MYALTGPHTILHLYIPAADRQHMVLLQQEVQQLRRALAEERSRNDHILALLKSQLHDSSTRSGSDDHEQYGRARVTEQGGDGHNRHQTLPRKEKGIHKTPTSHQQAQLGVPVVGTGERGSLEYPVLKPHLPGTIAQKHRRRQALQKRFSRPIHTNNHTLQH